MFLHNVYVFVCVLWWRNLLPAVSIGSSVALAQVQLLHVLFIEMKEIEILSSDVQYRVLITLNRVMWSQLCLFAHETHPMCVYTWHRRFLLTFSLCLFYVWQNVLHLLIKWVGQSEVKQTRNNTTDHAACLSDALYFMADVYSCFIEITLCALCTGIVFKKV